MEDSVSVSNLTHAILKNGNIGLWVIEFADGKEPRMYGDDTMLRLICATKDMSPEEVFHAWYDNVHPDYYGAVHEVVESMKAGRHEEVQYPWKDKNNGWIKVRCAGVRNAEYKNRIRIEGYHQQMPKEDPQIQSIVSALSADYLNVYLVDLKTNRVRIIKVDGYMISKIEQEQKLEYPYYELCQAYIKERVYVEDMPMMLQAMHPEKASYSLKTKREYSGSYRVLENGEIHYYQFKYMRLYGFREADNTVIAAFKNIDALVEEEISQRMQLEAKMKMVAALAKVYTCAYYLDLKNGTYEELTNTSPQLHKMFGTTGNNQEAIDRICEMLVAPKYAKVLREFSNLDTVSDRLRHRAYISMQYESFFYGWSEMYLIAGDRNSEGELLHLFVATRSIKAEKELELKNKSELERSQLRERLMKRSANTDALTGLLNRRAYDEALDNIAKFDQVGLIFCDLNGLKFTNDHYGHSAGDERLIDLAKLLQKHFFGDVVYRISGDEFVVLITGVSETSFKHRAEMLEKALVKEDNTASIGAVHGDGKDYPMLYINAEKLMYEAKAKVHLQHPEWSRR